MERIRDPRRRRCSSSSNSPTGLLFKRRPTCNPNEEDGQVGLSKETVTLRDRAARKERERERLRELLNQGKKKRRRISSDKLVISPRDGCSVDDRLRGLTTAFSHCHSRDPQLKPSVLSPAIVNCASVPRKPRSVGTRRKGKSWGPNVFDAKVQLPSATALEKSSPSFVQNKIEAEIAEFLYCLKKQASPSDEPLVDDLEKIPVENENQLISIQDGSVDKASKEHSVDMSKSELLSVDTTPKPFNEDIGIPNHDKAVVKQEMCTAQEGSLLCSKSTTNCNSLTTSEVVSASTVEAKSKHQEKFVIDLMKPPPMELSSEGDGGAGLTSDLKIGAKDAEEKWLPEKATVGRFLKEEVVDEKPVPQKMAIKVESHELHQGSPDHTKNKLKQQLQRHQKIYSDTSIATQIGSSLLPLEWPGLSTCPFEGTHIQSKGGNHLSFASVKPSDFHLIQRRPKRCATHHSIAQSIYRHQQALAAKLYNDNDLLSSERRISRNLPGGLIPGGNLNSAKDRAQGIEFFSRATQQYNSRPTSTVKNIHEHASYPSPMPLQNGHMAGPFIFPLSQNQTVMANQSGLSLSAALSTGNTRFNNPNGAPFLAVLPGNVYDSSSNGKKMQSSDGGKNIPPMPSFNGQLHPAQVLFPVQMQQQQNLPFTTRAVSSAADIRTSSSQRNVTSQSLFPHHSPNIASMSSAGCGGYQWKYAEKDNSESGEKRNSTSSFSFASSTQSHSTTAGGPNLNLLTPNSVWAQSLLDNKKLGSQILRAGHEVQHRNSMQPDGERKLAAAKSPTFMGQSGFNPKLCSSISPASVGAMVFDTSVTTPNYKLSVPMQNALSARIHLNNSNPLGAFKNKPTSVLVQNLRQQTLQTMAASQLKLAPPEKNQHAPSNAAIVSKDFSIFSGNLYDRSRSSHSLQQRASDIKQASEVFPASASRLCNSTLHNTRQKLATHNSHIQI